MSALNYVHAILHLRPGAQVAMVGGTGYGNIQWGVEAPIAQAELDTALAAAQTAHDAAEAQAAAQATTDAAARSAAKADATNAYLVSHTPAECYAKVQTDVTDLASAKQMLGRLAMAVSVLARRELR